MALVSGAVATGTVVKLLPLAIKFGLPILTKALKSKGGSAGRVAAEVIDTAAAELDVEPTAEAIEAVARADPDRVQTVLKQFEEDRQDMLLSAIEGELGLVAADQASEHWYTRGVRPTGLYLIYAGFAWILGCASFAPETAKFVVSTLKNLPAEYWYMMMLGIGSYTAFRTGDKWIKGWIQQRAGGTAS